MAKTATISQRAAKPTTSGGSGLGGYIQSIVAEGKKIAWPTMPQIIGNTITVVLLTVLFSTLLWALDNTFRFLIGLLTTAFGG